MSEPDLIALIDIGKTNAKLILLESGTGRAVHRVEHSFQSKPGTPYAQLNIAGIEQWLLESLALAPDKHLIEAIAPVAHGAAAVWIDANGNSLAAPDYEDPAFDSIADSYRAIRDPFAATLSPWLPLGLNLGRQLFFIETQQRELFERTARIVPYPQYWAARLSGVFASEVTSLGCHTDLWNPRTNTFSAMAVRRGWSTLFPPLQKASATLGTISKGVISATDLDPTCRVVCGIHDSNAAFLGHSASGNSELTVISSGTWTILMSRGGRLDRLREEHDMLANVDSTGTPLATARFMGGREYEVIAGPSSVQPTDAALASVFRQQAVALPCFADAGGPFAGRRGQLRNATTLSPEERAALGTVYLALITDLLLDDLNLDSNSAQNIVIDGPLAANAMYAQTLAAMRDSASVYVSDARTATCNAAHLLATGHVVASTAPRRITAIDQPLLREYRDRWLRQLGQREARIAS